MLRHSAGGTGIVCSADVSIDGIGAAINALARAILALQAAVASRP
jgi:hypothetical protein